LPTLGRGAPATPRVHGAPRERRPTRARARAIAALAAFRCSRTPHAIRAPAKRAAGTA
jgi:hypothetical protein